MVVVIPLEATERLIQIADTYQLNLPVPLSSQCASYLSKGEMDSILEALAPLVEGQGPIERFVTDLMHYRDQENPITPCQ